MSENASTSKEVNTTGPDYLAWRGELLAKLALSRLDTIAVYQGADEQPFDFLAATNDGLCFFVEVKAFSSTSMSIDDVESISELRWQIPKDLVHRANESHSPVILFLFDADTDHGRYLRLDTLSISTKPSQLQTIRFPIDNVIDREHLEALLDELQSDKRAA